MSQGALAKQLNLSFQRVQEYERANRISGSTLVRTAAALGVVLPDLNPGGTMLCSRALRGSS
jgi:transcriptional regulator with XRE-family HTH domain